MSKVADVVQCDGNSVLMRKAKGEFQVMYVHDMQRCVRDLGDRLADNSSNGRSSTTKLRWASVTDVVQPNDDWSDAVYYWSLWWMRSCSSCIIIIIISAKLQSAVRAPCIDRSMSCGEWWGKVTECHQWRGGAIFWNFSLGLCHSLLSSITEVYRSTQPCIPPK